MHSKKKERERLLFCRTLWESLEHIYASTTKCKELSFEWNTKISTSKSDTYLHVACYNPSCYMRTKWPHRNYLNWGIWHPGQGEQKQWASVLSLRLSRRYRQQSFEKETEEKRAHGLSEEYSFIWQLLGCRVKFRKNYYPVPHLSANELPGNSWTMEG